MEKERGQIVKAAAGDLHIHTCLSPCGDLDMTPIKIIKQAVKRDLAMIAITDHNSAENTAPLIAAARNTDVFVIPGIEVTTYEEAHIVGLFNEVENALSMQELVYDNLQSGVNDEEIFGIQVVANEFDEVEDINTRLLIGATSLSLNQVINAIHERGGLAVAAHIDRDSFSVISQLGFIPVDTDLDVLEISRHMTLQSARMFFREYENFPFITSSDAHFLDEIGSSPTLFRVARPNMAELRLALGGLKGRKVLEERMPN
ncbi:MAG TPA: histidinol phosphatase [Desulfobacteraceae bacterium]|nr:histidinol phosphatase [Desulfobacteraceae bacterium]